MHIESLKDQQKSSFYIAKFENAIGEWRELKKRALTIRRIQRIARAKQARKSLLILTMRYGPRMSKRLSQL